VRIVLALKNLEFTYIPVHLLQNNNVSPDYLEKNPMGQVPFLVYNDFSLSQSLAMILYLESKHPEPSLLPSSLESKAKVLEVCEIINSGIQPLQNVSILGLAEKAGYSRNEWAAQVISEGLFAVEKIIEKTSGTCCFGSELTLADAFLVPQIYNARRYNVDLINFPTIVKVNDYLSTLPEFQKSSPESQPDAE
jgi:maleylacetoacetate isomerase